MKTRLITKLFIAFAITGTLVVAVAAVLTERQLESGLIRWIEDELTSDAEIIALMPVEEIMKNTVALAERSRARLTLVDAAGRVTADSDAKSIETDNHLNRPEIQEARLKGKGTATRYSQTLKTRMLYVAVTLEDGAKVKGYIRLGRSLREIGPAFDQLNRSAFRTLLLVVFCALAIALAFSLRALSPIRTLVAFTDKVRRGDASGMILVESSDEIGRLVGNINDIITVLQGKIRAAKMEKGKLEAVFTSMAEGIVVLDAYHRIETVNRGMERMIGRRREDILGMTTLEAFRNVPLHDALERFRETGETVCQEVSLGHDRPVVMDVTISTALDEAGGERKTIMVFHDVTRLKKLERVRTDFVANVTHEIRTPLTAIIGFVETLLQGAVDDRQTMRNFLETIRENAQRLNRLVDDLLVLSGFELGEVKLVLEKVAPGRVIDEVLTVVASRAAEKRLRIVAEVPEGTPHILADRDRLAQILLNIIDNAVKFTPEGGSVTVSASPGEDGCLTIGVTDTGVGIPKSEIPRLGERFYRVDKTRSRELGGTGLGLSIVKHLMKAHQGRMSIDSTLGRGTTVFLHFPFFEEQR
jgi:two-component system, OmpR family, phosphate regulon sensor histidine kinase PhoR